MRITEDTDASDIRDHVADRTPRARLRTGDRRRDRLQRSARIRSGEWDLDLSIDPKGPPATVRPGRDGPELVVTGRAVPQPATDYPPREWDLLVQKALVAHEVGHLRFSAHDDFRERLAGVEGRRRALAAGVWNAIEDAAVETAIRARWATYGEMLAELRANRWPAVGPGVPDPGRGGYVFPVAAAAVAGALDATTHDSGTYRALLDPGDDTCHFDSGSDRDLFRESVEPHLSAVVGDVLSEPDAVERNRLVFAFVDRIGPAVDAATADGSAQFHAESAAGRAWGLPDDAGLCETGPAAEPADALDGTDAAAARRKLRRWGDVGTGDGVAGRVGDEDAGATGDPGAGRDGPRDSDDDTGSDAAGHDEELSIVDGPGDEDAETDDAGDSHPDRADLEATLAAAVREGAAGTDDDVAARSDELDVMQRAVEKAGTDLRSGELVVPTEDWTADEAVVEDARDDAARLARLLRNRFQSSRNRKIDRGRRRGRLDSTALHRAATGERRLMMRRDRPDDPDRHCLFVLDRSGSMSGDVMRVAERAMGMLAFALESVDVNVAVLELYDRECRLAKPFGRPVDAARDRLFHGRAKGGTPLADTLHLGRERLAEEGPGSFLFVVTDGTPAEPERYMDALDRCPMPVVGVNLSTGTPAGANYFHRQVTVAPDREDLRRTIRQLLQEVLFG